MNADWKPKDSQRFKKVPPFFYWQIRNKNSFNGQISIFCSFILVVKFKSEVNFEGFNCFLFCFILKIADLQLLKSVGICTCWTWTRHKLADLKAVVTSAPPGATAFEYLEEFQPIGTFLLNIADLFLVLQSTGISQLHPSTSFYRSKKLISSSLS